MQEIKIFNNNELTTEDLNNMKYLEQVIKETMRLVPAIPMVSRVLTEDVVLGNNFFRLLY